MWLLTGDKGNEFQTLGAITEKNLPPIDERRDLGTQRSSPPDDRSKRGGVYGESRSER